MRGVRISYLIEHPEYAPQLAQWLFDQWGSVLGEETIEVRIKKLKAHLNRDKLPIAWVAHANGQLLGTAALRVHDLEAQMQKQNATLKTNKFHEDAIKILEMLFDRGDLGIEYMADAIGILEGMAQHYADVLAEAEMITQTGIGYSGFSGSGEWSSSSGTYGLTKKGRAFVAKRRAK